MTTRPTLSPPPATITLLNRSTLVADADAALIAQALDIQLTRDVCPAWGLAPLHVTFLPAGKPAPAQNTLTLLDTLDDPQAAGFHSEDRRARVFGVSGVKAALDNGASVLTGPYSVATISSHEAVELACDRHASVWCDSARGFEIACEVADPTQSDHYDIQVPGGRTVTVSNFVTPDYFDPQAQRGTPLDYLGVLRAPFGLARGGYYVRRDVGQDQGRPVFGDLVPGWVREMKLHALSRTQHRVAQARAAREA